MAPTELQERLVLLQMLCWQILEQLLNIRQGVAELLLVHAFSFLCLVCSFACGTNIKYESQVSLELARSHVCLYNRRHHLEKVKQWRSNLLSRYAAINPPAAGLAASGPPRPSKLTRAVVGSSATPACQCPKCERRKRRTITFTAQKSSNERRRPEKQAASLLRAGNENIPNADRSACFSMLPALVASFCASTRLPLGAPPALPLVAAQPVLAPLPLAAVESALGGLVDLSIAPPVAHRRRTLLRKRRQYFEEEVCLTDGPTLVSRCLAEAGGTAFIVLCIGLAGGDAVGSFVAGGAVGTAVAAFSKLSGAHYNPAITIALAAGESFPLRDVPAYIAAQYAGACLATASLASIIPPALPAVPCAFAAEATVTAILMYVCLAIKDGIESGMVKKRIGPLLVSTARLTHGTAHTQHKAAKQAALGCHPATRMQPGTCMHRATRMHTFAPHVPYPTSQVTGCTVHGLAFSLLPLLHC